MPYSITTRDGITIDGIPDDVPADHPSLKARVAAIRGTPAPAPAPAIPEGVTPSAGKGGALGGLWMGLRDPIDAGAQLLARGVDAAVGGINSATGLNLPRPDVAGVDNIVKGANADREASRRMAQGMSIRQLVTEQPQDAPGFDGWRLTGNIVNPVNIVGGWAAAGAKTLPQLALRGAQAGAVGSLTQPVLNTEDFWTEKAQQAGTGALTGAVATPVLSKLAEAGATAIKGAIGAGARAIRSATATPEQVNVATTNILAASGLNPADLTAAMRDSVRRQVEQALAAGAKKLDGAAMVRQAQAEGIGLTGDAALTLGQRTRDPMQYAKEQNLSGVNLAGPDGAGNPLSARFAAQNRRLGDVFGQAGASGATDRVTAGQTLADALRAADAPVKGAVDEAYQAARAMASGRAAPLERGVFNETANQALEQGQWGRFLPAEVRGLMNDIAMSRTPFDVDAAVQIDGILAAAARKAGKGTPEASAIGVVRDALHATPLSAVDETAGGVGQIARDAFDKARRMARERFAGIEANPALAAALDGAAPDRFVQQFLMGAPVREVQALRNTLQNNPEAMQQARAQIAETLRNAAFGPNLSGDKVFAADRYARTLAAIGPQKLAVFFSPDELVRLNLVGKVASDLYSIPAGAQRAVNTSGTTASATSAVLSVLDGLSKSPILRNIPGARALANQVGEIKTEREIAAALSAKPAQPGAQLTPEAVRAMRLLLPPAAVGLGATVGAPAP